MSSNTNPALDADYFRGDVPATCRRLFAAGVPSDQCYCAAKALILSVRSEA